MLAALLFTERSTITMGELAERLQASSGAISGAIKMLTSVGLVERAPGPASQPDHYRLRDDAWAVLYTNQNVVISAIQAAAEAGLAATGDDNLARQARHLNARLLCLLARRNPGVAGTLTSARSADRPPRTRRDNETSPAAETAGWLPGALRSDTHRCGAMGI